MSKTEKFMYLRNNVIGEPLDMIQALRVVDENYDIAWASLEDRYDNPRQIVKSMLNKLFNLERSKAHSYKSLKKTYDTFRENMCALEVTSASPEELLNMIFHQLFLNKLDSVTHTLYEQQLENERQPTTIEQLLKFVARRFRALEHSVEEQGLRQQPAQVANQVYQQRRPFQPFRQRTALAVLSEPTSQQKRHCNCKDDHTLSKCPKFIASTINARYQSAKKANLCLNCLRNGHSVRDCKSRKCTKCQKSHHTMLHFEKQNSTNLFGSTVQSKGFDHVFLGTVVIHVMDVHGLPIKMRALLDAGAQLSVMSEQMLRKTGLKSTPVNMQVTGLGSATASAKQFTTINLASVNSNYKATLEVFIMKTITTCQPANKVDISTWKIPKSLQLADPNFNLPANVDLLIGGELFYRLLSNGLIGLGNGLPDLQNTVFGWVVVGRLLGLQSNSAFSGVAVKEDSLEKQLEKFWLIEEKATTKRMLTDKESQCEKFFEETTKRQADGRFIARLQFTDEPKVLGHSKEMAIRRFLHLEKRFNRDTDLKTEYCKFMQEYIDLGHMEELKDTSILDDGYYVIPHHCVHNPSSSTTKFRVVFDASAKTTKNVALNEILANGPMIQDDLFSIMVRFRMWRYVFSADIGKMYRQILVAAQDRRWQLIVWRNDETQELKIYQLNTLTYGTTCASYLATKTLQHLADIEQSNFPLAAIVAKRDFNVDDVMTGSNNLNEAMQCQHQLINMLKLGKMELHKWCANHSSLLEAIPEEKREISLNLESEKTETKALGMKWIPSTDLFLLNYEPKNHKGITKRTVLSETAQLFDPLGLVNPVILKAKVFMQELWQEKRGWDDPLPDDLQQKWTEFRQQLLQLTGVAVPRHLVIHDAVNIQMHVFSDACERAYGAAVYIRSEAENGDVQVQLLCSKSRVAPVSKLSIPRLELCGAVISTELAKKMEATLCVKFDDIQFWTDSQIVLSWILNDQSLKTFVANRVSSINRRTKRSQWNYVPTDENPADIVSRGVNTTDLLQSDLWWHGPEFLKKPTSERPTHEPQFRREECEEKTIKTILHASQALDNFVGKINHRNCIKTWQRIVAYCIKFACNKPDSDDKALQMGSLSKWHLDRALIEIIKHAQQMELGDDIAFIKNGQPEKTKFKTMTPILDANGILRVGGRLQQAGLLFDQQHPIILPYHHEVTVLIMRQIHLENMHAGPQALLAITRQKYWPLQGKILAKSVVDLCILCSRTKPKMYQQIMSSLPKERVTPGRAFLTTAVDFAGPIVIHYPGRGTRTTKAYICVFVCFSTKAVHLEAATDLSSTAFLRCLKRFIARRGIPQKIYSDNATNFKGVNNNLMDLADMMASREFKEQTTKYCWDHHIEWKFMPPRSPHFGGLHESAVKSAKQLLSKVLHNHILVYDELTTVLAEIEAILNSRPLTALSNDPNDLQPLTPGHFLTGAPLRCINDEEIPSSSKLQQWRKIVEVRSEFWKRWTKEYLQELQYKKKWRIGHESAKIGTLVIIKDPNLPPLQWRMGRIVELWPGKDGVVRVVNVKTSTGFFTRAIHELAPLPSDSDSAAIGDLQMLQENSKLNAEATEFTWPNDNINPDIEPINRKELIKKVKKVNKRKTKKLTETNNSPRITRSGRRFAGFSSPMTFLMIFMALFMTAMSQPCNTTQFKDNPGLFFEKTGQMSLSNNAWSIICRMNMRAYWQQANTVEIILQHLKNVCPTTHPTDHCDVIIDQLQHQFDKIKNKDELLQSFSSSNTRQRRNTHTNNFFELGQKNAGRISYAGKAKQQVTLQRQRRGWFDGVGIGAGEVFGILNTRDAEHYEQEFAKVNQNSDYLKELIKNQTLIQEITANIIRVNDEKMLRQIMYLNRTVQTLAEKDDVGKTHIYNALYMQATIFMTTYRETQNTILDLLTSVFHGKIPPTLISPHQLKDQLQIVSNNIGHDLMVPGDDQQGQMSKLYTMLSAKVRITKDNLIVKIIVPLVDREYYHLYHIVPVPFIHENKMQTIVPSARYIAVNLKQDHYYMLTQEDKQLCEAFQEGWLICNQHKPLFSVQDNRTQCEISVMLTPKTAHNKCKIIEVNRNQVWTALASENTYLYTAKTSSRISIICTDNTKHCTIDGSGLFTIPRQCMIKSGTVELTARHTITGDVMPVMLVPSANITDHITSRSQTPLQIENWDEIISNSKMDVLDKAIAQQKENSNMNFPTQHDVHQYTVTYLLVATLMIISIAYCMKKRLHPCYQKRTSNNEPPSEDGPNKHQTTIELHAYSEPKPASRFTRPGILDEIGVKKEVE